MTIIETSTHYEVGFSYNPITVAEVKTIPGRTFDPYKKLWLVPVEAKNRVNELARKYGVKQIPYRKEEWDELPPLPDLEIEIPSIKRVPFPFQRSGVAAGLKFKRFICGDDPGLGKTTEAIMIAEAAGCKCILVVCPSTLKENWRREWEMVAGVRAMILTDKVKVTWPQFNKVGMIKVFITNYESLKKYFVQAINKPENQGLRLNHISFKPTINMFDMVICDELHKCKDGKTQQAKFVMGICRGKEWVIGLTGTPVVNKPKDLVSQLHVIGQLEAMGGYKHFMQHYCGGDGSGAYNLKELNYRLSTTCFFRRQKKDVLPDLPDKMRQIILCDIDNRKEYDEAIRDLGEYLMKWKNKTDSEVEKSLRGEIMVRIGICKNISARGKLQEVMEFIDEITDAGEKVGIFIHQKEIARALLANYPYAVSVRGDDTMEERQRAVDSFQNNPDTKLIVCSIKAAGVGLTLTAASRMGFVELPWHAADCDQCEDRFHRIGQKGSVQCAYFLGKDTIDEEIYKIIESKRKIADTITGSEDNVQREIIDKLTNSLFNKDNAVE